MSINPESEPSRAQERSSCYAEGPNFSVTLPGSDWFLAHDYKVPLGIFFKQQKLTYSFAAMRKGPESDLQDTAGILKHDRIYYVAVPEDRISNNILEIGTPDLLWLLDYVSELSNSSASYPPFSWTEEVEAFNTSCVVIEHPDGIDPDVVRYKIYPYAYTSRDFLLVTIKTKGQTYDKIRERVLQVARSVELKNPAPPKSLQILERALSSKVTVDEFLTMMDAYWIPNSDERGLLYEAAMENYKNHFPDDVGCYNAGILAIKNLCEHATIAFNKALDAYELQVKLGIEQDNEGEFETLKNALAGYFLELKPDINITPEVLTQLDPKHLAELVRSALPGPEITKLQERMTELELI